MSKYREKIILGFLSLVMITSFWSSSIDDYAVESNQTALKRALITYGFARGINGVISVLQETEISAQPAGVGMIFAPGQILDPINDLIERFSVVMLISSASLGVQELLLIISKSPALNYLLTFAVLVFCLFLILEKWLLPNKLKKITYKIFLSLILLRFIVPVFTLTQNVFFETFLLVPYEEASKELEKSQDSVEKEHPVEASKDSNLINKFKNLFHDAKKGLGITGKIENIKNQLNNLIEKMVRLISIFLIETILAPLLFLWCILKVWKKILPQ